MALPKGMRASLEARRAMAQVFDSDVLSLQERIDLLSGLRNVSNNLIEALQKQQVK